jgi:hypothetical protein
MEPESGREIARLASPEPSWLLPKCFTTDGGLLVAYGSESRAVHVFDLRAIRKQLKELDLDWDAPPLAPQPADSEPLEVEIDLGGSAATK